MPAAVRHGPGLPRAACRQERPGRPPAQPQPAHRRQRLLHQDPAGAQGAQRRRGMGVTGVLATNDAVFLPEAVRIAKVTAQVGGSAGPGAPVLSATSDKLHVRIDLEASQQGPVRRGGRNQITLPGNTPVTGRVASFGRVAQAGRERGGRRDDPDLHRPRRPGQGERARPGPVDVDIRPPWARTMRPASRTPRWSAGPAAGWPSRSRAPAGDASSNPWSGPARHRRRAVQVEGDLREGDAAVCRPMTDNVLNCRRLSRATTRSLRSWLRKGCPSP